jgi:hypothetical protein
VHLVGFYLLLLSLMHGTMNLKFTLERLRDQSELIIYEEINTKYYECVTAALVYQHANSIFSTQLHLLPV